MKRRVYSSYVQTAEAPKNEPIGLSVRPNLKQSSEDVDILLNTESCERL